MPKEQDRPRDRELQIDIVTIRNRGEEMIDDKDSFTFFVLEGAGDIQINDVSTPVLREAIVHIPPGTPHSLSGNMRVLAIKHSKKA